MNQLKVYPWIIVCLLLTSIFTACFGKNDPVSIVRDMKENGVTLGELFASYPNFTDCTWTEVEGSELPYESIDAWVNFKANIETPNDLWPEDTPAHQSDYFLSQIINNYYLENPRLNSNDREKLKRIMAQYREYAEIVPFSSSLKVYKEPFFTVTTAVYSCSFAVSKSDKGFAPWNDYVALRLQTKDADEPEFTLRVNSVLINDKSIMAQKGIDFANNFPVMLDKNIPLLEFAFMYSDSNIYY
jgi:hypothetical protein